jgi:hypothetical protein
VSENRACSPPEIRNESMSSKKIEAEKIIAYLNE